MRTRLVDLSTSGKASSAEIPLQQIALYHRRGPNAVFSNDRGEAVAAITEAFENWIRQQHGVGGIISAGGSGGTAMVTPAMRALPVGIPKVMISTVASGNVRQYVGPADIMMMYSVADVQGLNSITREVLTNGANAMTGMIRRKQFSRLLRHLPCRRSVSPCLGSRRRACSRLPLSLKRITIAWFSTPQGWRAIDGKAC